MRKFCQTLVGFVKDESGPTAVEYAVMLALIIVVCITAVTALGTNASNTFSYVGTNVGQTGSCLLLSEMVIRHQRSGSERRRRQHLCLAGVARFTVHRGGLEGV